MNLTLFLSINRTHLPFPVHPPTASMLSLQIVSHLLWMGCIILLCTKSSMMMTHATMMGDDTCTFRGVTFARGAILTNLETECGTVQQFPCFCNPDLPGGVQCPYCGFATNDGRTRCARDGDEITFISDQNAGTRCVCDASDPTNPISSCQADASATTCQEMDGSGNVVTRQAGDMLEFSHVASRCGSMEEFPCFCDPNVADKVSCPYCGIALENDGFVCLKHEETQSIVTVDNLAQECTCTAPGITRTPQLDCSLLPTTAPIPTAAPSTTPDCQIAILDTVFFFAAGESLGSFFNNGCGPAYPCFCNPLLASQVECPYCGFANPDGSSSCARDDESFTYSFGNAGGSVDCTCAVNGQGTDNVQSAISCTDNFELPLPGDCIVNDQVVPSGQSYGALIPSGVCGSFMDFPSFCDTAQSNNIYYPYCTFSTMDGSTVCAKDGESIQFTATDGTNQECSCTFLTNQAETSCTTIATLSPTRLPTPQPTPVPTPVPTPFPTTGPPTTPSGGSVTQQNAPSGATTSARTSGFMLFIFVLLGTAAAASL